MDFDQLVGEVGELAGFAEAGDRFIDSAGGGQKHLGLFHEAGGDVLDVKKGEAFHQRINRIHDVIQVPNQGVNILTIEGGNEGAVEAVEGGVAEIVGLMLLIADHLNGRINAGKFGGQLVQMGGRGDDPVGNILEKVVEDRVLGEQVEHGGRVWRRIVNGALMDC